MIRFLFNYCIVTLTLCAAAFCTASIATAADTGWSIISHVGFSQLEDQSPVFSGNSNIADGRGNAAIDPGFSAGISVRYDYPTSPWFSEIGWEYRSNDAVITTNDETSLPGGNYASNIFFLNQRYALTSNSNLTPWIGGGFTWVQEIDLDSEGPISELSFSDSGAMGLQVMAGFDYRLTDRIFITSEIRYSSLTGLELKQEGGNGLATELNYRPLTLGIGIGFLL